MLDCELTAEGKSFQLGLEALEGLVARRSGCTVLVTSREDWSAGQVVGPTPGSRRPNRCSGG